MRLSFVRPVAAVSIAAVVLAGGVACGEAKSNPGCPPSSQPGIAVAMGARANSPKPQIPKSVTDYLAEIPQDRGITIVRVDGAPSVACGRKFHSDAKNPTALAQDRHNFGKRAMGELRRAVAQQPEADPLAALTLAGVAAGPKGTVVLADSGLQTKAPLDFRTDGLLFLPPEEIVAQLRSSKLIPDLTDRTVVLAGIGWTAPPQKQPHEGIRQRLLAIWKAIVEAGGGKVEVLDTPNSADAVTKDPTVSPVSLPDADPVQPACGTEIVLPDGGAVGFQPNTAAFREPGRARSTLLTVADFLRQNPAAKVTARGSVAHYGVNVKNAGLALDRARAVTDTLVSLGVDRGRVTALGDGWGPFEGKGDEIDQRNRRVVLKIDC